MFAVVAEVTVQQTGANSANQVLRQNMALHATGDMYGVPPYGT